MAVFVPKFLRSLRDVLITSPSDGETLSYEAASGKWKNAAGGGGGGAPTNATYITQTANGSLSNEQAMGSLGTGLVKNTTTTGVQSIAAAGTDYYAPGSTDVAVADGGTGSSTQAGARTNLGLVIGTDVEAHDSDLTTIAGLSPTNDDIIQRKAGAWTNRTMAQLISDLAALGTTFQALDATLTALAGANWAANALPIGTGTDTLSQTSFAANTFPARASTGNLVAKTISDFALTYLDDADAATTRATLGVIASLFKSGGAQAIALDTLAATTDITTLNASTSAHGLLPKLDNTATHYLDGTGAWSTPAGGGFTMICDSTLGSDTASFDTNSLLGGNIPGTYKHLVIEMVLRSDRAASASDNVKLQFNADTTSGNYKTQRLNATAASITTSSFDGTQPGILTGQTTAASSPANSFCQMSIKVNNYLSTSHHKMAQAQSISYSDSSGPAILLDSQAGIWLSTSAITRIVAAPLTGSNWKTGSRFTLYGVS